MRRFRTGAAGRIATGGVAELPRLLASGGQHSGIGAAHGRGCVSQRARGAGGRAGSQLRCRSARQRRARAWRTCMNYFEPLTRFVDLSDGSIPAAHLVQRRHLSDLAGLFADQAAEAALTGANPLLYEVHEAAVIPKEDGHLLFSTTVVRPGTVGDEYFMTKGHYHARADRSELYYGLAGEGLLLMQTP